MPRPSPRSRTAGHDLLRRRAGAARPLVAGVGVAALAVSAVLLAQAVDVAALGATWRRSLQHPTGVALALGAYALAFTLRARIWQLVLPQVPFGHALAAVHVSLAGNHLLPLRLGEPLRALSVIWRAGIPWPAAAASTVALRTADVLALIALAAALAPGVLASTLGPWAWALGGGVAIGGVLAWRWLSTLGVQPGVLRSSTLLATGAGAAGAWMLEGVVVWEAAHWAGLTPSPRDALLVATVSVAVQVIAVTPGGVGTYEAAAVSAWSALGVAPGQALAAAVAAHLVKTAYALATGAIAVAVPAPALVGRVRLARPGTARSGVAGHPRPGPDPAAPVLLFLPAHDEETTVAGVLARVPATVCGHPVDRLVIDDGSQDQTSREAARGGAEVRRHGHNLGLGAAVRHGLREGWRRGAAAVAFCDADGEYDPAELERLIRPILDCSADYVVGSRFIGDIRRMLPHRRLGNRVLTAMLAVVARQPVTDGQSGFRALSAAAARDAEIVHDYNYAQVLTLDLLGKGYRYAEVPITYGFRERGRSFVRLGQYLRRVVPAVYLELNADRLNGRSRGPVDPCTSEPK